MPSFTQQSAAGQGAPPANKLKKRGQHAGNNTVAGAGCIDATSKNKVCNASLPHGSANMLTMDALSLFLVFFSWFLALVTLNL